MVNSKYIKSKLKSAFHYCAAGVIGLGLAHIVNYGIIQSAIPEESTDLTSIVVPEVDTSQSYISADVDGSEATYTPETVEDYFPKN